MMNNMHGITVDEDTVPMFESLIRRANGYGLAYVHLSEPFMPNQLDGAVGALSEVAPHFRPLASSAVDDQWRFRSGRAEAWLADDLLRCRGVRQAVHRQPGFAGTLPARRRSTHPIRTTFYQGGEKGYVDYPVWETAA